MQAKTLTNQVQLYEAGEETMEAERAKAPYAHQMYYISQTSTYQNLTKVR